LPRETLLRELQEEAGVPAGLARHAQESGIVHSQRIEADGVHDELLYCFDLLLPDDFVPANQDGEVATFECVSPLEAAHRLPAMTGDAAAVTARWLRAGLGGGLE
jgi:8-oxo-dGTP pyrophosphatase MutT (NUDIX family)